jgi:signal peptidase I
VTASKKKILSNEYLKTFIAIGLVVVLVVGGYFGLGLALGTDTPIRVVESGSMCTTLTGCDGWSDVFNPTLHVGDLIIIQKVSADQLSADYPNSDIIVYENPSLSSNLGATPIVHRIVAKYQVDGTWYFQTKGDGNGEHWPAPVSSSEYDSNTLWSTGQGVSADHVLGKVVMRVPYIGWITLLMRNTSWALPLVIILILMLVLVEFVYPALKPKKKTCEEQKPAATSA